VKIDATASMRCWAVDIQVGDGWYRIPALPAADWMEAIADSYYRVVPALVDDAPDASGQRLADLVLDGAVAAGECTDAAREAIEAVAGVRWWVAVRLVAYLREHWSTLGGAVLARGVDPARAPLGAVLTVAYRLLLENCKDEQERQRLDLALEKIPPGVAAAQAYDADRAAANFMALGSALNG
jgi:hypothetical protein